MANTLGKIWVELGINSAAFSEGMSKATYATAAFGKKTSAEFRNVGNSLAVMAGAFGMFGSKGVAVASAISLAGRAAGDAIEKFSGLSKTFGALTGVAAGATAAFGSLVVGTLSMAIHTAGEMFHEMERQAQSAGVNVTQFSRLAYATRVLGLEQETLVKGLQRMNRAALMAAEGSKTQQFAFQMLLGSGKDFQDVMHNGTVNLEALAEGFRRIKDPQLQSAMAMQVFGRAGAQLVPLLNEGAAGMKKLEAEADALGVTISEKAAAQATLLMMNLERLKEAGDGLAIRITTALMPALDGITNSLVTFAKNGEISKSIADAIGNVMIGLAKIIYEVVFAWEELGDKIEIARIKMQGFAYVYHDLAQMIANVVLAPTGSTLTLGKVPEPKDYDKRIAAFKSDIEKQKKALAETLAALKQPPEQLPPIGTKTGGRAAGGLKIPTQTTATAETDQIKKYIADLDAQALAAKRAAAAINETMGAQAMLNAQDQAEEGISKQRAEVQERIDQLTKQIAANAHSYSVQQRADYQAELSQLKSYEAELDTNHNKIIQLYATIAGSKEAKSATQGLEAETVKYAEKIKALGRELAAISAGKTFHAQDAELAGDIEKVQELQDALAKAQQLYGNNSDAVRELAHALAEANVELSKHREQLSEIERYQIAIKNKTDAQTEAKRELTEITRRQTEFEQQNLKVISEGLAKAIVLGKENFRQLGATIEESFIRTGLANLFNNISNATKSMQSGGGFKGGLAPHKGAGAMGMLGGLLGFGKTPGGSPSNPMFVKNVDGMSAIGKGMPGGMLPGFGGKVGGGGIGGAVGGVGAAIGDVAQIKSGAQANKSKAVTGAASAVANIPVVGPFLATAAAIAMNALLTGLTHMQYGGAVTPGRSYIVGEKHPEIFTPSTSGRIIPSVPSETQGGGAPQGHHITMNTSIQALDSSGVEDILNSHAQATADAVHKALRSRGVI